MAQAPQGLPDSASRYPRGSGPAQPFWNGEPLLPAAGPLLDLACDRDLCVPETRVFTSPVLAPSLCPVLAQVGVLLSAQPPSPRAHRAHLHPLQRSE